MDDVLRACPPDRAVPADHPFYVNLTPLRNDNVQLALRRSFGAARLGEFVHRCLCGHRGSGKSTELLRFVGPAAGLGYFPVAMQVFEHLGTIPLEFSDLCLLMVVHLERVMEHLGIQLPAKEAREFASWFWDIVKESKDEIKSELQMEAQVQIGNEFPFLGKLIARLTAGVKAGSVQAVTVREHLQRFPGSLRDRTNSLLDSANTAVRAAGYARGLVLFFDQLDRYHPDDIDRAFVKNASLVCSLRCHAIYTVPIALHYRPVTERLDDHYGPTLEVPMVILRKRGTGWSASVEESQFDADAVMAMSAVLRQRVNPSLFEDQRDLLRLTRMSGGCVRDLLHLVRLAWEYSEERFTSTAVSRGIGHFRRNLADQLDRDDYPLLAQVARQEAVERSDRYNRLLHHRLILRYHEDEAAWCDVHPALVDYPEFQNAYRRRTRRKN